MSSGDDSFTSCSSHDEEPAFEMLKTSLCDGEMCFGCGLTITDRFLLKVSARTWHVACLRCCVCQHALDRQGTCFIRDDNIYCKIDYARLFGTKCSKCLRTIQPTDWVRRAKSNVYHLACFACDSCKRQLSTGEEFALHEEKVLCKTHYIELIEGGPNTGQFGLLPEEQGEAGAHHIHGGTAAGAPGQLPTGQQPRRPGPGANSADHRPEQEGHASLVSELKGQAEEAPTESQGPTHGGTGRPDGPFQPHVQCLVQQPERRRLHVRQLMADEF